MPDDKDKKPGISKPPLPIPKAGDLKPPPLPNLGAPKPPLAPKPPIPQVIGTSKIPPVRPPVRKPSAASTGVLRVLEVKEAPKSDEPQVKFEHVYIPPVKHKDYMMTVFLLCFIIESLSTAGIIKAVDVFNLQPRKTKIKQLEDAVNRMIAFRKQKEQSDKEAKDKETSSSEGTSKKDAKKDDEDLRKSMDQGSGKGKGSGQDKNVGPSEASTRVSQAGSTDFDPNAKKGEPGEPERFDVGDKGAEDAADKILGGFDDDGSGSSVTSTGTWTSSSGQGSGSGDGSGKYSRGSFGPGAPGAPGGENIRFNRPNVNLPSGGDPKIGPARRQTGPKETVKKESLGKMNFGSTSVGGQVTDEIKQQISSVVNGGKGNIRRLYNDYTKRGAK
ncbi:MAG: hypothetical protein JXA60_10260, partial [Candidatus Coatesbacteria bacterium]|nr:hypothetical protein [Candidatus Coatesbacteria bacterium]